MSIIAPALASRPGKYQECLGFGLRGDNAEGWLTIRTSGYGEQDGNGWLSFKDDDLECEQEDGPLYRVANLPASELIAIRDFLNRIFPPAQ